MIDHQYHPKVILRTPLNPFHIEKLPLESIYLASTSLFRALNHNSNEKAKFTLHKYQLRASTRCPPFGLFAGCSVINVDTLKTNIELVTQNNYIKSCRLDMNYVDALFQKLNKLLATKKRLTLFPNTSITTIYPNIRYIESYYKTNKKTYQVSEIVNNEYVVKILKEAEKGATIDYLVDTLVNEGFDPEASFHFINSLVINQLLISDLEPCLTNNNNLGKINNFLEEVDETLQRGILLPLRHLKKTLQQINDSVISDNIELYKKVIDIVRELDVEFNENNLFHVDLFKPTIHANLSTAILNQIKNGIEILLKVGEPYKDEQLEYFKKAFLKKYEEEEIPLTLALDPENGIGYGNIQSTEAYAPLMNDLALESPNFQINMLSQRDLSLLHKLQLFNYSNDTTFDLAKYLKKKIVLNQIQ